MHEIDPTTDHLVRSVLAYAENRLRLDPVPLDTGTLPAEELNARLAGLIRRSAVHPADHVGRRDDRPVRVPAPGHRPRPGADVLARTE